MGSRGSSGKRSNGRTSGGGFRVGSNVTNADMTRLPVGSVISVEMPRTLGGTDKFDLTLRNFTPAGGDTIQRWSGGGYSFDNSISSITEELWTHSPTGYPLSIKVKKLGGK